MRRKRFRLKRAVGVEPDGVLATDGVDTQRRPLGGELAHALLERAERDVDRLVAHRPAQEEHVEEDARLGRVAAAELEDLDAAREALGDLDRVAV
jgi:hypothetical protein